MYVLLTQVDPSGHSGLREQIYYGLVGPPPSYTPNPDLWVHLLWPGVLGERLGSCACGPRDIRTSFVRSDFV